MREPWFPPGSVDALVRGCRCPVLDNGHGRGYMGGVKDPEGETVYVMNEDCLMHGAANSQEPTS